MFPRIRPSARCTPFHIALICLLALLSGCARLPVAGPLPEGLRITETLSLPAGAAYVWSPDGERVAVARDGLSLWTPGNDTLVPLWPQAPTALAWSPDGSRLALALPGEDTTRLVVIENGGLRHETRITGDVRTLFWPEGEGILCFATTLKAFSFGGNFVLTLYRWSPGEEDPAAVVLHDGSLKPLTLHRWGATLYQTPHPALSPLGDELLYARLHDPPAFPPYLKIILRHLETGAEREVAVVPVSSGCAVLAGDGESVIYGDGESIRTRDPWLGGEGEVLPLPGYAIALSPGGHYLFADGRLYRDGVLLATFPAAAVARFSPSGGKLLLQHKDHLFLLSGVEEETPSSLPEAAREKLLQLRKWRSRGLLTPQEYIDQKGRLADL